MSDLYDVIIIGAGPAGLTAGLYCVQAGLRVLALERETPGGQLMNIEKIENYPGFSEGVSGPELGQKMALQAMNYGLEFNIAEVRGLKLESRDKVLNIGNGEYRSKAVIIAGGGHPMPLGVPGEEEYKGKGIAYCALCEGGQFKGKTVAVAGGGDAGITEALYLTKIASKVIIVEIMPELNAKSILKKRAMENEKIQIICDSRIMSVLGDGQVKAIQLFNTGTENTTNLDVDGVFVHVGWQPQTKYLEDIVPLDKNGYILVNGMMETALAGIFAAGDTRVGSPRQVATAIGDGTTAAIAAQKYLREIS
jgi:thioredoxin reductase (NADPH)